MAVAEEQENRAKVVAAEAEVPRAMAEAFRQGNLGIMDYRMKNVQADTAMREGIAGLEQGPGGAGEHRDFLRERHEASERGGILDLINVNRLSALSSRQASMK